MASPVGKQAKPLSEAQQKAVMAFLRAGGYSERNMVQFLLSVDAGLRAKEMAVLTWAMVTDSSGRLTTEIRLENSVSKGKAGGVVSMSKRLHEAFVFCSRGQELDGTILKSARGYATWIRNEPPSGDKLVFLALS